MKKIKLTTLILSLLLLIQHITHAQKKVIIKVTTLHNKLYDFGRTDFYALPYEKIDNLKKYKNADTKTMHLAGFANLKSPYSIKSNSMPDSLDIKIDNGFEIPLSPFELFTYLDKKITPHVKRIGFKKRGYRMHVTSFYAEGIYNPCINFQDSNGLENLYFKKINNVEKIKRKDKQPLFQFFKKSKWIDSSF